MNRSLFSLIVVTGSLVLAPSARAQKAPEAGYIFPAGGKAGTTINVVLGGYDWTPDMEYFVHDKRVQLIASGPPGPILIPPPPYWFGQKGRLASMPLAREVPAKIVLPANLPPGPIYWQAANANGVTESRVFIVGTGIEVVEDENRKAPQPLLSLPITVSGRLFKNEEVDRYRVVAAKDGPISCELMARRLGTKFHGVLQVYDGKGQLIVESLGANGSDPSLTFVAKAKTEYVVSVHDIDFGGDRSYVYRLNVTPGPRVVGAIPAAGKRGETREIEFVVDTGAKLESIKRPVVFPATSTTFGYRLETPSGAAAPFQMLVSDQPGITGVLEQPDAEHRHPFTWKKGEIWSLAVDAKRIGSPLDVALAVIGPDGKDLAKNDDLPGTTDAGLEFTVPADGAYQVVVSDMAGKSGSRAAIYRLVVSQPVRDFTLQLAAPRATVQLGGKLDLAVNVIRTGGFKGPIALTVKGLPAGVSVPPDLVIPGDKAAFPITLQAAKDAGTLASLVTIEGTADVSPRSPGVFSRMGPPPRVPAIVSRTAHARTSFNLSPQSPDENPAAAVLVATTLKPLFKGRPVDQDTGRKVHRGSTFPAEVLVERLDGFNGEITLRMAATQSYQMQGITGPDVLVPPGVGKTLYPVFMPEWLETTRTSRCGMIAVAKATDPKGKVRWACSPIAGYITMTLEGALLKVSADEQDMTVPAGQPFDVNLKIARLTKLNQPAKLELRLPDELSGQLKADTMVIPIKQEQAVMRITPTATLRGLHTFTIRATALQDGKYLAVSEVIVTVEFLPSVQTPRK
ncbi:MAG: hypothetical protein EXR98_12025 [Gemmataceae bacterium]|nr:hypothetical protein [Gemmataceae bacterium]